MVKKKTGPKTGYKHDSRQGYEIGARQKICVELGHKVILLLEEERKKRGIPQSEFCPLIGITSPAYNRSFHTGRGISLYCVVRAYKILNWDINSLKEMVWP